MSAACRGRSPYVLPALISSASAPGTGFKDEYETEEQLAGLIIVNENLTPTKLFSLVQLRFFTVLEWVQRMHETLILGGTMQEIVDMCARRSSTTTSTFPTRPSCFWRTRRRSPATTRSAFRAPSMVTSRRKSSRSLRSTICLRSGRTPRPHISDDSREAGQIYDIPPNLQVREHLFRPRGAHLLPEPPDPEHDRPVQYLHGRPGRLHRTGLGGKKTPAITFTIRS